MMIGRILPEHFAPDTLAGGAVITTSAAAGVFLAAPVGLAGVGSYLLWKVYERHITRWRRDGFWGDQPADFIPLEQLEDPGADTLPVSVRTKLGAAVLLGFSQANEEEYWLPNDTSITMNPNMGIIGNMGSGKTQFMKAVIWQLSRMAEQNRAPLGMLVFDYKTDYSTDEFKQSVGATSHKLHRLPYNPLALFGDMPRLPVHAASAFTDTVGRAFGLGEKQRLRLMEVIGEAYELAGIFPDKPATWKRPAPTLREVWDIFKESEQDRDSLYAVLHKLISFEIFEEDQHNLVSLHELIDRDGITIIDLAGYDPGIKNLVVGLTLDQFYAQMQRKGKPTVDGDFRQITKMVVVDEADNFMSQDFPSLKNILKEGREYGVGTILSTQQITHFRTGEDNYALYMKSWVVHSVDEISPKDIRALFNVTDKAAQDNLMESIRNLGKHQSYYVASNKQVSPIRDKAYWEWMAETP
ncbi:MAG: hypothetical protein BWK73_09265 [Thiothrix lacustris]|uniref:Helicase HerA central domain-containing protein n=1 Tax=Thiothrix lacustris TaxID=525917 RepID=A0A1Y1QV69_9GAMM|nr:MAG: hypothetical protein BWK73_09265 [Thiothrix lacustris]